MSSSQRASIVAASVGVVEALKDQRVCRWNHTLKSAQHVIKSHVGSLSQAKNLSFSSSMLRHGHPILSTTDRGSLTWRKRYLKIYSIDPGNCCWKVEYFVAVGHKKYRKEGFHLASCPANQFGADFLDHQNDIM
ncbi:hypothetical protein JHK87_052355 [Glycine soja]|nr:hypothetical protein JHK87_052355 [Glycine soja]